LNQIENEITLITAFKKGDPKAFEKLFDRHHKKLYLFLYRLLNSKEDAEEIVQDTFIKIWEKRAEFIEGYPFESFLFKIAKNAFLNLNRKRVNRKIVESHLEFLTEITSGSTDEYVIFNETKAIVNTIIDNLPPKRKEIFLLRRIEGLSRQEIADKLDISIITVDSQLLKANKYLKEELKKYSLLILILFLQ
jgi:RNA polymerase sigma-70 factor (ECF subfamily)